MPLHVSNHLATDSFIIIQPGQCEAWHFRHVGWSYCAKLHNGQIFIDYLTVQIYFEYIFMYISNPYLYF